jgi:hypothetical protein
VLRLVAGAGGAVGDRGGVVDRARAVRMAVGRRLRVDTGAGVGRRGSTDGGGFVDVAAASIFESRRRRAGSWAGGDALRFRTMLAAPSSTR